MAYPVEKPSTTWAPMDDLCVKHPVGGVSAKIYDEFKHDHGKLRWDLVPPLAMEQLVAVLTMGAGKYGDWNWKKVPDHKARFYAATQRHLSAWRLGNPVDRESGLPALAHAIVELMFLLELELEDKKGGLHGA